MNWYVMYGSIKIFGLFLVLALLCSCNILSSNKELKISGNAVRSIEEIRRAIHFYGNAGPNDQIHIEGTGFFINEDGYFVTNLHVLLGAIEYKKQNPQTTPVVFVLEKNIRGESAVSYRLFEVSEIPIKNELIDLAVCKLSPNPFADSALKLLVTYVNLDPTLPQDGEELFFSGFPNQAKKIFSRQSILGSFTVRQHGITKKNTQVLELATGSEKGFSGAPVYRPGDGAVIGIVVGGLFPGENGSAGVTDAIPVNKLIELLDTAKIKWYKTVAVH